MLRLDDDAAGDDLFDGAGDKVGAARQIGEAANGSTRLAASPAVGSMLIEVPRASLE